MAHNSFYYTSGIKVMLTCNKEWMEEELVNYIDIEEDMEGKDVLTFECPVCNEVHRSRRFR